MSEPVVSVKKNATHTFGVVGVILAAIISAGTIIGQLGGAFFVTRTEYTKLMLEKKVEKEEYIATIKGANESITAQIAAMARLQGTVEELKDGMAKMNAARLKKRQ